MAPPRRPKNSVSGQLNRAKSKRASKKRQEKPDCTSKSQSCGFSCIEKNDQCQGKYNKNTPQANFINSISKIVKSINPLRSKSESDGSTNTKQKAKVSIEKRKNTGQPQSDLANSLTNTKQRAKAATEKRKSVDRKFQGELTVLNGSFSDSPEDLRGVINTFPPVKTTAHSSTSHYNHRNNEVKINTVYLKDRSSRGISVYRHEYGHYLDRQIGKKLGRDADVTQSQGYRKNLLEDEKDILAKKNSSDRRYQTVFDNNKEEILKDSDVQNSLNKFKIDKDNLNSKQKQILGKQFLSKSIRKEGNIDEQFSEIFSQSSSEFKMANAIKDKKTRDLAKSNLLLNKDDPEVQAKLVESYLKSKFGIDYAGHAQDLIGATTTNKVGKGHSDDYYKRPNFMQGKEAFANITSLYATGDELVIEYLRNTVPNQFKTYRGLLRGLK